jgi:predicted RNase H-like HicB family nuclease
MKAAQQLIFLTGVKDFMTPQHTVKALVRRGKEYYVAECVEIAVVTQGKTLDETLANLQEAVALHLEGEDPVDIGLAPDPIIVVTMELEPASAQA